MKKFILFIICIFFFASSFSQITFQKVISGAYESQGNAVRQTADNGYITAGYIRKTISDNKDAYLIKTNEEGSILWTKTIGGSEDDEANAIEQTIDGGFIIAGTSTDTAFNTDLFLVKTNSSGDTVWTKAFNGVSSVAGNSVQQTFDGGYIVAGWTDSYGVGGNDIYLIKTNASGDTTWTKTYGGIGNETGNCVKQTSDSGYVIVGYTLSFGQGSADVYLIKTNANGTILWTKSYGGTNNDIGYSVLQTADNGFMIAGQTNSFGSGHNDVYLIKTNSSGDTLWTRTYGGIFDDGANEINQTTDGGYIITGTTKSGVADTLDDVYLIRTDGNGDTLWTKSYGGSHSDDGFSAEQTKDGGFIISGYSKSFLPAQSYKTAYLIKTDANGNSYCNQSAPATMVRATATKTGGTSTLTSSGGNKTPAHASVGVTGNDSSLCLNTGFIEQSNDNRGISAYPNPAADRINIKNIPLTGKITVDIYNTIGEDLFSFSLQVANWDSSISIKNLASGIYFVRLSDDKQQWIAKFIKN